MGEKNRFYVDVMSANSEVTGSCNLCVVKYPNGKTTKFLVDCGLYQEKECEELNSEMLFNPEELEFVLITHNHVDHVGKIPFIVKHGFNKDIYLTVDTSKFLALSLYDSSKVLRELAKRKNQRTLYGDDDVQKSLELNKPCKYNETLIINNNIKVTFLENGHLIGAALILIQICYPGYQNINLLFTGDYNYKNMFFKVAPIPEWVLKLPITIIQESTYGDQDSSNSQKVFKNNIMKTLHNKGTVIVPVFSLGRAQEILLELKLMQDNDELPLDVPIYLDGKLAIKYTDLYINDLDVSIKKDFIPHNLNYVTSSLRDELLADTKTKVILTTSGMASYGPAQQYIPEYLSRKNALIHFTGYTAKGTLGRRLLETPYESNISIGGLIIKKRAEVKLTTEYSAHAKANQMLNFLKQFEQIRLVLINHGTSETKQIFASKVLDQIHTKRVGILNRDYFFRIGPFGFIKTLGTKFD